MTLAPHFPCPRAEPPAPPPSPRCCHFKGMYPFPWPSSFSLGPPVSVGGGCTRARSLPRHPHLEISLINEDETSFAAVWAGVPHPAGQGTTAPGQQHGVGGSAGPKYDCRGATGKRYPGSEITVVLIAFVSRCKTPGLGRDPTAGF